jgi:hypothetical protein
MAAATVNGTVAVRCPGCDTSWEVARRPDGTVPKTARCAQRRGGCGRTVKVPRRFPAPAAAVVAAWEPPSEPRQPRPTGEPCPHCGEAKVYAEPRGTVRVCFGCGKRVTPLGVLAPYERGAGVERAAKSQRERDLEALDLAGRKGVMLGQLRDLAATDRLDPASVLKVEWFAEQVKAAAAGARLDELAALFGEAGIRPRRWWQGRAAAITAGYDDEDTDEDGYAGYADEDDEDQADEHAAVLAMPESIAAHQHRAQPLRMTWADAIAVCGWRIAPTHGACQVIDEDGHHCAGPTSAPGIPDGRGGHAWLCQPHYGTLGALIIETNRSRGVA